jgi:hypothetical protein
LELSLLAYAATPPVFDGPEDRNGRRNADETALWLRLLEGGLGEPPVAPFVVIGKSNLDPVDGEGLNGPINDLLRRLGDPMPRGAAPDDGGKGDPGLDTVLLKSGQGLRVDVILPSPDLTFLDGGVLWPVPGSDVAKASSHGPVWLRLDLP